MCLRGLTSQCVVQAQSSFGASLRTQLGARLIVKNCCFEHQWFGIYMVDTWMVLPFKERRLNRVVDIRAQEHIIAG
jgi:hypothetical protein